MILHVQRASRVSSGFRIVSHREAGSCLPRARLLHGRLLATHPPPPLLAANSPLGHYMRVSRGMRHFRKETRYAGQLNRNATVDSGLEGSGTLASHRNIPMGHHADFVRKMPVYTLGARTFPNPQPQGGISHPGFDKNRDAWPQPQTFHLAELGSFTVRDAADHRGHSASPLREQRFLALADSTASLRSPRLREIGVPPKTAFIDLIISGRQDGICRPLREEEVKQSTSLRVAGERLPRPNLHERS